MNPQGVAASVVAFLLAVPAGANDTVEPGTGRAKTAFVKATERTNRGKLGACEIEYRVLFEDYIYRRGAHSVLNGAVSFMGFADRPDKEPTLILKVAGHDFIDQNLVPFEIPYASVKARGQSYAGREFVNFRCETGGACVGYVFHKTPDLATAFGDAFSVSISRKGGNTDISIPVSVLRDFPEEAVAYGKCSIKLLTMLKQKLAK